MNVVTVNASKKYDVMIGEGLITQLGSFALRVKPVCTAVIISDSNVWPLYGNVAEASLLESGYSVIHYVFSAGEASKNTDTYIEILNFLAQHKISRGDIIIALGGGVTGDMAGFAAATYLRGIAYIQVPTSLLAMVDSSVGGKTAIDLTVGKNLVGAFYQPNLVLCDTSVLKTLPTKYLLDGSAEVIKYAILYDLALFKHLLTNNLDFDREYVITRCVELKRDVIMEDEFDTGARQKLNLGHTFGHSIEANSHFSISHGFAVATGMNMAAKAAFKLNVCNEETCNSIYTILTDFGLPVSTEYSAQSLLECALSDKKRFGSFVNLVLPERIGSCILRKTPVSEMQTIIELGL